MVLYGLVDLSMNSWDFYLGWLYEVPNHQYKCCGVVLDKFHVGL